MLSSLGLDWNNMMVSLKKNKKLPEREKIYAYIKEKIEHSKVDFLEFAFACAQIIPKRGM